MKNKTKDYLGARIDSGLMKDVRQLAGEQNRSVSNMAEILLREGVTHLAEGKAARPA